ncbi:MAG: T9SS type A sorting domain-containing protein, partial [Bacteroidia bacterium]|nr:T9SS type A sorting domain-containing protein [Bacteroidia bacterium]
FPMGQGWPGIQALTPFFIPNPPNSRPLANNMLQNTTYHDAYVDRLCEFATYDFTAAHLYPIVDSLANLIRADVYADPNKMYTNQQFETNLTQPISSGPMGQIPGLKDFIIGRRNALQTQLAGFGCTMVVGMEEGTGAEVVSVYPNPSDGRFKMEFPVEKGLLTIVNMQGKVIVHQELATSLSEFHLNLAAGIYGYTLQSVEGRFFRGKFTIESE